MKKTSSMILIGDLLVQAGLVTRAELSTAITIATSGGMPVGRVLVGAGHLTEEKLHAALRAQSLIRDDVLPIDIAIAGLQKMEEENIILDDALASLGWKSEYFDLTNKLGQLLKDAGLVQPSVISFSLHTCFTTGLPLGRVLVLQGIISDSVANAALLAQILIRDGKIKRDQAVDALKSAAAHHTTIEDSLEIHGYLSRKEARSVRLGELLVLAGLISEIDLLTAVEKALASDTPLGQVLVQTRAISADMLQNALETQKLVTKHVLTPTQGSDLLREVVTNSLTFESALQKIQHSIQSNPSQTLSLADLLRLVGLVPLHEMDHIEQASRETGRSIVDLLVQGSLVAPNTLSAVMRVHDLLQKHKLSGEQAIFVLHSWFWSSGDLDEQLAKLGWQS